MFRILTRFSMTRLRSTAAAGLMMLAVIGAQAQEQPANATYAGIGDKQLVIMSPDAGAVSVDVTDGFYLSSLEWSADGQNLAYVLRRNEDGFSTLKLTDRAGSAPQVIAEGRLSLLPVAFSPDSTKLYYATEPQMEGMTSQFIPQLVHEYDLASGEARELFEIPLGIGCGGGSPFEMDAAYYRDAGFGGNALIFETIDAGFVYSTTCSGVGLTVIDSAGVQIAQIENFARAQLSPDGRELVGVEQTVVDNALVNKLAVLDLSTFALTTLGDLENVDQVAWGADNNTVFFSTREALPDPLPMPEAAAEALEPYYGEGFTVPDYAVTLQRFDRAASTASLIQDASDGTWAITRLHFDGANLYASLIPDGSAWLQAVADGAITPDSDAGTLIRAAVAVYFGAQGEPALDTFMSMATYAPAN